MKYLTLILCILFPFFAIAEEITVEVGNTDAVLDIIQGSAEIALEIIFNNIDTEVNIVQGDTIKIIQGANEVIVEIVNGDQNDLIQAIQEKPDIHYFSKTEEEGMTILEIWGKPDIGELEREGYRKTTIENIHMEGYLTPSESEKEAEIKGDIERGNEDGNGYSSWINTKTSNAQKIIEAGSQTTRSWYSPGSLALNCSLHVWGPHINGWIRVDNYPTMEPWHTTWGWRTSKTFTQKYSTNTAPTWRQKGRHHWGNVNDSQTSVITKTY